MEAQSTPTIASALESSENLAKLKEAIADFDANDRQVFLEGLKVIEDFLNLDSEALDTRQILAVFKSLGISGLAAFAIVNLVAAALAPPTVSATVPGLAGVMLSSGVMLPTIALKKMKQKREVIAKIRELRNAVIDVGKRERIGSGR
jgi:hypothetical protein